MLSFLQDSIHDKEHVYRVCNIAVDIARYEKDVDMDILMVSCILHDIGRPAERNNPSISHAQVGGEKAFDFLCQNGWSEERANAVKACITQHRFRKNNPPLSIEAKILFDADKFDATGLIGIARTLMYKGLLSEPMYTFNEDGTVSDGDGDKDPSFMQEYKFKLEKLYDKFYTQRCKELAIKRKKNAMLFYSGLLDELKDVYK